MAPPLTKMNKEKIKYVIQNPLKLGAAALGRKLGVDRTTIMYWQKKLILNGFPVNKGCPIIASDKLLEELKKEL
jgi:hypothetical protein